MQLKSLELTGFKSFPEKTLITFSEGITAIIGPNGSGKSNISDAIRWVMGETSTKNLRGTKMEDVVFDGTQMRKALGFAEVTLTLDNSDKRLPIEFGEVAITRRYYRSGESEYCINKSPVRMRDVHDLLRDTGLGRSGYSIISQGSVTEIINAKSDDRRYLFEEASGIAKFRYKKEESERKLSLTNENIIRLNDIKAEIESRLGPLESQAKKAKKYLELYETKKNLEIALWLDDIKSVEAEAVKASEAEAALKHSTEQCERDIIDCEAKIESEAEAIRTLTAEIEDIRSENASVHDRIQELNSEMLLLGNETEHAKKDIERFEEQKKQLSGQREDAEKLLAEKKTEIGNLTSAIKANEAEAAGIIAGSEENLKKEAESEEKAKAFREELSAVLSRMTELQIESGRLTEQLKASGNRLAEYEEEKADADARLGTLIKARDGHKAELDALREKREGQKNIYEGYVLKIGSKRSQSEKAAERFAAVKRAFDEKTDRKRMLEDLAKHYEGFNGSVRSVVTEASKGVLRGVRGTVASVIKTEDRYTVAIETALGQAIQNIITEDEKSAKDCIYFLKSRNLGRATFLPMDTVSGTKLQNSGAAACPGYIGVASELLTYEPIYRGIIEQLLGRTVIADTIDNATDMAMKNRYSLRIVTLDGQVVNPGGSLTGGSVSKGIGILSRSNEVEALAAELEKLNTELAAAAEVAKNTANELKASSASLEGLNAEIKTTDGEIIRREAELSGDESYIENLNSQRVSLRKDSEAEEKKRSDIAAAKLKTDTELDECRGKARFVEDRSSEATKLSEEFSAERDRIREELHKLEITKTELVKSREAVLAEAANIEKSISDTDAAGALSQKQIDDIKLNIEEFVRKSGEAAGKIKELESGTEERTALIAEKTSVRNASEAKKTKLFESEKKLFEQKDKLGRELERTGIKCAALGNERDGLIAKIWDEYGLTVTEAKALGFEFGNKDEAKRKVSSLKDEIKTLGSVNVDSIDEFAEVSKRYKELSAQLADLESAKASLERIITELETEMTRIFSDKFRTINEAFSEVFRELFNGGSAKLSLTEPDNVLESGVDIYVAPPGKIIKHLSALSGGEQALTAIALYFALLKIRPAPFCLLDEIESALDDVNVIRFANYLRGLMKFTQFLVITHRRGTMEAADRLYGVTMKEKGVSRIITINVSEIENNMLG